MEWFETIQNTVENGIKKLSNWNNLIEEIEPLKTFIYLHENHVKHARKRVILSNIYTSRCGIYHVKTSESENDAEIA